ncbi:hypothetical protein FF36_03165 [Frankia torreyi]|uniref:Uncharacterized protein n=1 Tax=Frankia torreyi TaxID=1856 RepID=A0A0D8BDX8_9ACTN|nr:MULTISPECIES: hypothetical protein [Frankia]KJE22473.1 hypothetical protein FF36_03165 [Frankia torreyi]KQC38247.1 hypothetical protein UK82_11330 [Frankia sp. ACN1ag]KQM04511.1 hypothetical protein FF86_102526 [Frankia sp. CpI1-P]
MGSPTPRIPRHVPVDAAARHGTLRIADYQLGDHLVWAATDDLGVVALAGTREELQRALAEFPE